MARANRAYTGSRQSVGTPTLNRNGYMMLMKKIRKERERIAEAEREKGTVRCRSESPSELLP